MRRREDDDRDATMIALVVGAIVALVAVIGVGMLAGGCAATGSNRGPSMGCLDPVAKDCDDPAAYPPLTAQLPSWPFPRLLVPLPEAK